jgi:hypothetical protein
MCIKRFTEVLPYVLSIRAGIIRKPRSQDEIPHLTSRKYYDYFTIHYYHCHNYYELYDYNNNCCYYY